jgi:hypothetical protein
MLVGAGMGQGQQGYTNEGTRCVSTGRNGRRWSVGLEQGKGTRFRDGAKNNSCPPGLVVDETRIYNIYISIHKERAFRSFTSTVAGRASRDCR